MEVTALIVDDEHKNRETLVKLIDQFCYGIKVIGQAENVQAAKEFIDTNKPHIVFLDIEMPGGNGFTLLEKFDKPDFQLIFTTAHADYAIKAIKFAALDYLLKPINVNELIKLWGSDKFLPNICSLGPWSGVILINGKPKVIFIASYSNKVFNGPKNWSCYIPIITLNLFLLFFKNIVSAANGPVILIFFFKNFTAGLIIASSSLNLSNDSQCGFKPTIPILGLKLKYLL